MSHPRHQTPSRRRLLQGIMGLGVVVAGAPLLAGCRGDTPQAQRPTRVPQVGYLAGGAAGEPDPNIEAFRLGLRELGYVEGQGITIVSRYAEGRPERYTVLAGELVAAGVAVIIVDSTLGTQAARSVTERVPIVFANVADALGAGLVESLRRPGGNITGFTSSNNQIVSKRLGLWREVVPSVASLALLHNAADPSNVLAVRETEQVAPSLGLTVYPVGVRTSDELDDAFARVRDARVEGVQCSASPLFVGATLRRIVAFFAGERLPSGYGRQDFVQAGGLWSYTANFPDNFRRAAAYVDKLLKGANPAELPVQGPTTFDFVINLRAARELGLSIPSQVLAQATEVLR